ncbi:MAG: DUF2784 domain-containing protein [Bacteroidota bacterium]
MLNHSIAVFLDYFFIFFHTVFTLFNIVGWIWKKTRIYHLITIGLTALSWFIAGIWYGWGYCFCTDWHWQIRFYLGKPIKSNSYIHFLIQELTGINLNEKFVDQVVLYVFLVCTILSIWLFVRGIVKKRKLRIS